MFYPGGGKRLSGIVHLCAGHRKTRGLISLFQSSLGQASRDTARSNRALGTKPGKNPEHAGARIKGMSGLLFHRCTNLTTARAEWGAGASPAF